MGAPSFGGRRIGETARSEGFVPRKKKGGRIATNRSCSVKCGGDYVAKDALYAPRDFEYSCLRGRAVADMCIDMLVDVRRGHAAGVRRATLESSRRDGSSA